MRFAAIPKVSLCSTPTPLMRAVRLEAALGPDAPRLYIKRDDLTGLAFGGNKARKLEYLVADAKALRSTVVITEGAAQSNHARMTAAAAVIAGMRAVLVLDARSGADIGGNLLLDHLLGADVRIVPGAADRRPMMDRIADECRSAGETPYIIPTGGSIPIGAVGYVSATLELLGQLAVLHETPTALYFATASLGTQAGLAVGARVFDAPYSVIGISVDGHAPSMTQAASELANATCERIGAGEQFDPADISVDDTFVGDGYGKATPEGMEAIQLLARTEAILLDPVYSGKALAGLLGHIRGGQFAPNDSVVFLHTGGGPSLFAWGMRLLEDSGVSRAVMGSEAAR